MNGENKMRVRKMLKKDNSNDNPMQKLTTICDKCFFKKCWKCFMSSHIDFGFYPANQNPTDSSKYDEKWFNDYKWWPFNNTLEAKQITEGRHPTIIKNIVGENKRILDVGCGQGFLVHFLRDLGVDAVGVDYSEYGIKNCVEQVREYVSVADVVSLPFKDNEFDMVIGRELFEHITLSQAEAGFKEMLRVSKKYLYFTIWLNFSIFANDYEFSSDMRDETHITFATRKFWEEKFNLWSSGKVIPVKEMEKSLDWMDKRRCFIYEKR
jgi:ubiquinone/menaquinone biosynthesis C-methylase UbiE